MCCLHILWAPSPCLQGSVLEGSRIWKWHVPWVWRLVHGIQIQGSFNLRLSTRQKLHNTTLVSYQLSSDSVLSFFVIVLCWALKYTDFWYFKNLKISVQCSLKTQSEKTQHRIKIEVRNAKNDAFGSVTYHDSRDCRGDSPVKELEGVISNCLRTCLLLRLCSRCNHARLQENTLKKDIVLSKVEENLCPYLLGYFKSSVNIMLPIKQDLWLHNWDQSIVLKPLIENIWAIQNQYKYVKSWCISR